MKMIKLGNGKGLVTHCQFENFPKLIAGDRRTNRMCSALHVLLQKFARQFRGNSCIVHGSMMSVASLHYKRLLSDIP
jgi:hypothetical protein